MVIDRRRFLGNMSRWAAAGAALLASTGCGDAGDVFDLGIEDDLQMHGPIREAQRWLNKPLADDAVPLLSPYDDGKTFMDRWAIGHLVRGEESQLVVVMVDLDTGGHAELEIFSKESGVDPVARSRKYTIHLNDGGLGQQETPRHLRRLCERLAAVIRINEGAVELQPTLPSFVSAQKQREARWSARD